MIASLLLVSGTMLPGGMPALTMESRPPERFALYYSGPPCGDSHVDRTFTQFQVNLSDHLEVVAGDLRSAPDGAALLGAGEDHAIRLLSNASRADWLLSYPLVSEGAGVWGRPVLGPDCSVAAGALYVEALAPLALTRGAIDPALDLMRRDGADRLIEAVRLYRSVLADGEDQDEDLDLPAVGRRSAAARLERELFSPAHARATRPWRARLLGPEEPPPGAESIEILVSGSDGSTGMFGHIAVGGGGQVYNVYPKGSDRGAPGPVPLWDYLFNTQRGQALRRPTWILRLEGLPGDIAAAFHATMRDQIEDIEAGRSPYHPTANNCTTVSMKALGRAGFGVAPARYFTRRFPRPAFVHILARLPRLIAAGRLRVTRVEIVYVPQAPERLFEGGAPNRPIRDRSRVN